MRIYPAHTELYRASSDALEGKGPQRRSLKRLGKRLEEVAKAVGGGYCRLQMPLRPAFSVSGTVAGHRLGALEGGGGVQKAATRRKMRREERVTVHGPVKEQQPAGMSHRGYPPPLLMHPCPQAPH